MATLRPSSESHFMSSAEGKRWKAVSWTGMAIGIALIAAGLLWNAFAKPEHVWSKEQAEEFESARQIMHELTYDLPDSQTASNPSADSHETQLDAAKLRFKKIEADLAAATSRQRETGAWLTRMGLAVVVLFGIGYLAANGS